MALLDLQSPTVFDNHDYKTLVKNKGLLQSDQQLFDGGSTNSTGRAYSKSYDTFSFDCEWHDQDGRLSNPSLDLMGILGRIIGNLIKLSTWVLKPDFSLQAYVLRIKLFWGDFI